MARTVKIKVYTYDELSEAAQSRARDWWRSGPDENFWSEPMTEDLKTVAAFMGWTVTDTAFSGFCSQGDGAQFTGTWCARDVKSADALEQHAPKAASDSNARLAQFMGEFIRLAKESPEASASVFHSRGGSASYNTAFDTPEMHGEAFQALQETTRALMDWYYRQLEKEYEYQDSDERVAETIIANEYEFKANGDRFI